LNRKRVSEVVVEGDGSVDDDDDDEEEEEEEEDEDEDGQGDQPMDVDPVEPAAPSKPRRSGRNRNPSLKDKASLESLAPRKRIKRKKTSRQTTQPKPITTMLLRDVSFQMFHSRRN